MFVAVKEPLTTENIIPLVNAGKIFIQTLCESTFPIGDAAADVLSFASNYYARKASLEDVPFLMTFKGIEIYITPVLTPETSTFAEGIVA